MDFYSESRLQNWINKIETSEVSEEDPNSLLIFDQMLEDVIIACFNIINAVKNREMKKTEALKELEKIEVLFNKDYKFNSDLKLDIFILTVEAIKAIVGSFKYYFEGKFSKKSIEELVKDALENERNGKMDLAFDAIARVGAKVIRGEKLPELTLDEDSSILSWLDGVDAISTVIELSRIDSSDESDETAK